MEKIVIMNKMIGNINYTPALNLQVMNFTTKTYGPLLQIASDLHLEFLNLNSSSNNSVFRSLLIPTAPHLALLGDICQLSKNEQLFDFITFCTKHWKRVFYICGNHEFYRSQNSVTDCIKLFKKQYANIENFHVLENETYDLVVDQSKTYRIFGGTMWSHIPPGKPQHAVEKRLNDFRLISNFTAEECNLLHNNFCTRLEEEINRASIDKVGLIIFTHHAPLMKGVSSPFYEENSTRDGTIHGFCTDMTKYMKSPIVAWCFGHTHFQCRFFLNDILIESNPRGYDGEVRTYKPSSIVCFDK